MRVYMTMEHFNWWWRTNDVEVSFRILNFSDRVLRDDYNIIPLI